MNPPSMEVIFLLLSGVILVAGVLYWFWSHLQLTQKKVQLLENAVFELRTMLLSSGRGPPEAAVVSGGGSSGSGSGSGSPVAASGYEDLGDDDWDAEGEEGEKVVDRPDDEFVPVVGPSLTVRESVSESEEFSADLQPGGRILVPSAEEVKEIGGSAIVDAPVEEEQFRELFVAKTVSASSVAAAAVSAETLESMPVKELRRLAQERGIAGAADMRKKEILAALRQQIPTAPAATLDLTKMTEGEAEEVILEEGAVDEPEDAQVASDENAVLEYGWHRFRTRIMLAHQRAWPMADSSRTTVAPPSYCRSSGRIRGPIMTAAMT